MCAECKVDYEKYKKLATSRGNTVATASIVDCEPFHPKWVDISDYQASEINLEYSSVLSLHECHPSEEVQLRMIEDPAKSRNSVLEKFFIAPRYVKCENDPMNVIFVSHFFHSSLDNSVAVPKICLSLAREEFPGRYPNSVVSREFNGFPTPMTEVFLAILFRVNDGIYLNAVFDQLKSGSRRDGSVLVSSVLIRHEDESVADFEGFVRMRKSNSTALWKRFP